MLNHDDVQQARSTNVEALQHRPRRDSVETSEEYSPDSLIR